MMAEMQKAMAQTQKNMLQMQQDTQDMKNMLRSKDQEIAALTAQMTKAGDDDSVKSEEGKPSTPVKSKSPAADTESPKSPEIENSLEDRLKKLEELAKKKEEATGKDEKEEKGMEKGNFSNMRTFTIKHGARPHWTARAIMSFHFGWNFSPAI